MLRFLFWFCFLVFTQAQDDFEWDPEAPPSCKTPDQKFGVCISIDDCEPMLEALDQVPTPIPPEVQNYLKAYRCGFEGRKPKICCPEDPISFNFQTQSQDEFPDVSGHRNLRLLPKDCGYLDLTNKITNGQKTGITEFPWMALLSYRTQKGPQFKCGGTILNERYILTAAHCLANPRLPLLGVRVGEHNIRTQTDCETTKYGEICNPPFQDLAVEKVIVHPRYNSKDFSNDVGLIRVSPIDLSLENSRPVCLPLAENRNYNFTNRKGFVTGWGVTEQGIPSPELLKVALSVVPLEQCQQKYAKITSLDHRQLCAGGQDGKDSCGGDSGGPLHFIGRLDGETKMVQQGIVSFGPSRCGMVPTPGVYTRVAAFMDWILDNIRP